MSSAALKAFQHAVQDATDLLNHFDALNKHPPPPEAEVLKRASLVMALAALETYVEDRIREAVAAVAGPEESRLSKFYKASLEIDLKVFHSPNTDRVKGIFEKYLNLDVTKGWTWNNYEPDRASTELNRIVKKRGDIAHRSWRPIAGVPTPHAVTRDDLRKHIRFIQDLAVATDAFLESNGMGSNSEKVEAM